MISVCESCEVTDIAVQPTGIAIHTDSAADPVIVDLVAIATGHLWPEEERASRQYFPSPWTGLMEARIAPCRVGILGTSLSAIDAAVAVVARHGVFPYRGRQNDPFFPPSRQRSAGDHPDVTPRRAAGGRFLLPDPVGAAGDCHSRRPRSGHCGG